MADFDDIPLDPNTKIITQQLDQFAGEECVIQLWSSEGITAMSLILRSETAKNMGDAELKARVEEMEVTGGGVTISRGEQYTFVNYNFGFGS